MFAAFTPKRWELIAALRAAGPFTLGIENYVSVLETHGPKFAAALEAHAKAYDVDIMNGQRVAALEPAEHEGGEISVTLDNGAVLKSRSVILSTGARWKNVNEPGEAEYRNKGVADCPHCDGPPFKGRRVAVIGGGGGNSGVEAAIDLAGVAGHVTVVEFADQLKADAVPVNRLKSLAKVDIQPGRCLRRRRRDHGALQADHHRRGRRRQGGTVGLRAPDPHAGCSLTSTRRTGTAPRVGALGWAEQYGAEASALARKWRRCLGDGLLGADLNRRWKSTKPPAYFFLFRRRLFG